MISVTDLQGPKDAWALHVIMAADDRAVIDKATVRCQCSEDEGRDKPHRTFFPFARSCVRPAARQKTSGPHAWETSARATPRAQYSAKSRERVPLASELQSLLPPTAFAVTGRLTVRIARVRFLPAILVRSITGAPSFLMRHPLHSLKSWSDVTSVRQRWRGVCASGLARVQVVAASSRSPR